MDSYFGGLYMHLGLALAFNVILFIVLIILLLVSFLLAGSEIAFFSLNYKDINVLKTRQQPALKRIVNLLDNPKVLLASMLIANCFVNIGIILISNVLIDEVLMAFLKNSTSSFITENLKIISFILKVVLVTLLILLFAEILPKVWATHRNLFFASLSAPLIDGFARFFSAIGITRWLVGFSNGIEKKLNNNSSSLESRHIDDAIDLLSDDEATADEKNILKGIRKFSDTTVKQVMRSRLDVHGINQEVNFDEIRNKIEEFHYSRIPIYNNSLDEIIGLLHTKDVLPHLNESTLFDWRTLLRPPFFIHEQKLIDDLLQDFRNKRIHFAVVVDEFGGTSGIVTLEDIMEEVIGDIKDEFDEDEPATKKIDANTYLFDGKTTINDACKIMDLNTDTFDQERDDSDTIAGLVLELSGSFPLEQQEFELGDFKFIPSEIKNNRIGKVKVIINPDIENQNEASTNEIE